MILISNNRERETERERQRERQRETETERRERKRERIPCIFHLHLKKELHLKRYYSRMLKRSP